MIPLGPDSQSMPVPFPSVSQNAVFCKSPVLSSAAKKLGAWKLKVRIGIDLSEASEANNKEEWKHLHRSKQNT